MAQQILNIPLQPYDVTMVLYHYPCRDGFMARVIAQRYLGSKARYIPVNHGSLIPDVTGENVLVVDISWKRDDVIRMKESAKNLLILDHHVTAQKELEGLPYCFFDMERCGAVLTWNYFYPVTEDKIPLPILYIQDQDLWQWKLEGSKEFSIGLEEIPHTFEEYSDIIDHPNLVQRLIAAGESLMKYKECNISRALTTVKYFDVGTSTDRDDGSGDALIGVCNVSDYTMVSNIGNRILDQECVKLACCWHYNHQDDVYIVSLRSNDAGYDSSVISHHFSGGGHRNASGFRVHGTATVQRFVDDLVTYCRDNFVAEAGANVGAEATAPTTTNE